MTNRLMLSYSVKSGAMSRYGRGTVTPPTKYPTTPTPWLPFDMPTDDTLQASGKIIAPHFMCTQWRSVDNKGPTDDTEYTNRISMPDGAIEAGSIDHRVYGGRYRNRPIRRAPLPGSGTVGAGGWWLADKRFEVQSIKAAGFTGMTIDILGADTFPHANEWAQAAQLEGWTNRVVAMPDASVSIVRNGPTNLANYMAQLFGGPYASAWRKHTDGRWIVMPYGPEFCLGDPSSKTAPITSQQVIDYWRAFSDAMIAKGYPIALWCCFSRAWLDANEKTAPTFCDPQLADIVIGLGRWGARDPGAVVATGNNASGATAYAQSFYNKKYVYTLAIEDSRPSLAAYWESAGWDNVMKSYDVARTADFVQAATANDWGEGTGILPSTLHGYATLDVMAYYNVRHLMGEFPPIIRDACYLAYRVQNAAGSAVQPTYTTPNKASNLYTKFMTNRGTGTTPDKNQIDVLVFATAPAQVIVTVGGVAESPVTVPAGVSRVQAPMRNGAVSVKMVRGGITVPGTTANSTDPINMNTQLVQDLTYRRISSLR